MNFHHEHASHTLLKRLIRENPDVNKERLWTLYEAAILNNPDLQESALRTCFDVLVAEEDVEFIEDGANSAPDGVEFIGEDEENDSDAVKRARTERLKRK